MLAGVKLGKKIGGSPYTFNRIYDLLDQEGQQTGLVIKVGLTAAKQLSHPVLEWPLAHLQFTVVFAAALTAAAAAVPGRMAAAGRAAWHEHASLAA